MQKVSLDRLYNAAQRGSVIFKNAKGGCTASRNIGAVFASVPIENIIGVYDSFCLEQWLIDDLAYFGFDAQIV